MEELLFFALLGAQVILILILIVMDQGLGLMTRITISAAAKRGFASRPRRRVS